MSQSTSSQSAPSQGILYVVATPIGNMDDLSPRARSVLSKMDLIAAEDTRHTSQLLSAIGVNVRLISLHEHNEQQRAAVLIDALTRGSDVALVSDAGTPLISDPGFDLVRLASAQGIRVVPIPGPCAAITALSVAGLPTDRFVFEGFLSAKSGRRREQLLGLRQESRTLVFYEAPHRAAESLRDMAETLGGERRAAIGRELTKAYETCYYGTLAELADRAAQDANLSRGELVIVIAGGEAEIKQGSADAEQVLRTLLEELPAAQAAKLAARLTGVNRSDLYALAVRWKKPDERQ